VESCGVVVVALKDRVLGVNVMTGQPVWEHRLTQAKYWPGIVVDPAAQFVFSDGPRLMSVGPTGRSHVLHEFAEVISTLPVFTTNGELAIGTEKHIYRLTQ
jgi:hypothetical protein